MNDTVSVFDFDKTLTDKDTLFGYYRAVAERDTFFAIKRMLLLAAAVLYKIGIINNRTLKRAGVFLFLKGVSREELDHVAQRYGEEIELNDIYSSHFMNTGGEKWIISASPEIYLRYVFPDDKVAGTTFTYDDDRIVGLSINMFGAEKRKFLAEKGITRIHKLYTDSSADQSLMDISEHVFIVSQGRVVRSA